MRRSFSAVLLVCAGACAPVDDQGASTAPQQPAVPAQQLAHVEPAAEPEGFPSDSALEAAWAKMEITPLDSANVRLGTTAATERDLQLVEAEAFKGDYQAQRNFAYALTSKGWWGHNPVLGCAWRMVILVSGSSRVDETDVANKRLYCDERLDRNGLAASQAQAEQLYRRVYQSDTAAGVKAP